MYDIFVIITTTTRSINSTRGFHASTFRAVSARYARYACLRFARVPRVLFCAGSARVAAFKYLQEIYILRRILLLYVLGNLYIITLGTLRIFTWKTWEP